NAAAYVAAGRLLQERHPSLFWTPCAAHCIDLLLEDIGKIDWVSEPLVRVLRLVDGEQNPMGFLVGGLGREYPKSSK
ncbi:hypothetical protein KI387_002205, partial [Taxus chinensis]